MGNPSHNKSRKDAFRPFLAGLTLLMFLCAPLQGEAEETDAIIKRLDSPSLDERNAAVDRLGWLRDAKSIAALITTLYDTDEDWLLRKKILVLFREIKAPLTVGPVMFSLYDFCPAIRWNAAITLGELPKSNMVVDALIYILDDRALYIREAAIQSIGRLKAEQARPFLITALKDKSFAIRHAAIKALQLIGSSDAVEELRKIAENDPDSVIRNEAMKTLKGLI